MTSQVRNLRCRSIVLVGLLVCSSSSSVVLPQVMLLALDRIIVRASDGQSVRRVNVSGDWSKRPM